MLYTEKLLSRRKGIIFPQPERIKKIQKSMGAVRHVLGERKRDKLASLALASMEDNGDYQPLQQGDVNLDK
jgi:large subunit ribosomal protein L47